MAMDRNSLLEQARKKITDLASRKNKFWAPQNGDNLIRILPWSKDELFYYESRGHFIPWGGERGRGTMLACMEPLGKSCLACTKSEELQESENAEEADLGKRISATSRYFYNIVDLKSPESGVQVWSSYSEDILSELLSAFADPDIQDFTDPEIGRNIVIHKKDQKPPRYETKVKVKASPIQNRQWLKEIRDLKKLGASTNVAEMKKLLGEVSEQVESDDSDMTKDELIDSLECFAREYNKLEACPTCPVKSDCRKETKIKRIERAKKKAQGTIKKKVRRA